VFGFGETRPASHRIKYRSSSLSDLSSRRRIVNPLFGEKLKRDCIQDLGRLTGKAVTTIFKPAWAPFAFSSHSSASRRYLFAAVCDFMEIPNLFIDASALQVSLYFSSAWRY
jgi:hypothetical protein